MKTKQEQAADAIHSVGCSATWHICINSEGCKIEISGFPVMIAFMQGNGTEVFYESRESVAFEDAILRAADAYELTCYPERGARWLPVDERKT